MKRYIVSFILNLFAKRGLIISINKIRIVSFNKIQIKQIHIVSNESSCQFVDFESITIYLSIWRSLCNFSLAGEICFFDVRGNIDIVSEKKIELDSVISTFKLGIQTQLLMIDISNISLFVQKSKKIKGLEVYFEIVDLEWNDLMNLLRGHLIFSLLKEVHSKNKISVYAHMKKDRYPENNIPLFDANIKAYGFQLYNNGLIQKGNKDWIDKDFLINKASINPFNDMMNTYLFIDKIPSFLINAIICTEDPHFWIHHGISPYFIGYALHENLQKRKVVRGASTITMQVAKNLFLTNNRTFLRKIEECIIAILLENYFKIAKSDIMEIYLNIIEFAPEIYGINAACQYYFGKRIQDLSIIECLVLTYIIPRPNFFKEALVDKTIQLKQNLYNHIKYYSEVMLRNKFINKREYNSINYKIQFTPCFGELDLSRL